MNNEKRKSIIIILLLIIIAILVVLFLFNLNGNIPFKVNGKQKDKVQEEKKLLTEEQALNIGRELYDEVTEIYLTSTLIPYCGYDYQSSITNETELFTQDIYGDLSYQKAKFTSLEDLRNYLSNYLSQDLIGQIVTTDAITDLNDLKMYTDYIIYNDVLYCRAYTGAGYMSNYLNDYRMSIKTLDESKITFNIKSSYAKVDAGHECLNSIDTWNDEKANCDSHEIEYKDTTFKIEKVNDNWIVTDYTFHD